MGIKERQTRERDTVRRAILNAARTLFLSEGYANVSMRKIAERIEYSPGAIYSYFPGKEDIFFALAEEGLQFLRAHCECEDNQTAPLQQVRTALWRFYTFSKEQPEYFSLIFVDSAVPRISRDWERFSFVRDLRHNIEHQIQKCIDEGLFPGADSVAQFWHNIIHKVDCITDPPPSWRPERFCNAEGRASEPVYTGKGGYLGDLCRFNPAKYGVMPASIDGAEPDHFLALRCAHEALADAGVPELPLARQKTGIILGRGLYHNRGLLTWIYVTAAIIPHWSMNFSNS